MEDASGKKLDVFFTQWLYRAGHPMLEWSWNYDAKTQSVNVTVNQAQAGDAFQVSLEIGIYTGNGQSGEVERVWLDKKSNKFSFKTGQKPLKIELDPNTSLLYEGILKN